jgi:hypothetical protein
METLRINRIMKLTLNTASALSGLLSLGFICEAAFASFGWQPETLRDISQLQIKVSKSCPFGASEGQLRSGIENYLSQNGIPINASRSNSDTQPSLIFLINCQDKDELGFAFTIIPQVIQSVNLNGRTIRAVTYDVPGYFGTSDSWSYSGTESEFIVELLDDFIADWHSVR